MGWIDKQRNILDMTISSMLRRRWKNVALFLVYSTVVFLIASVVMFKASLKEEATEVLSAAPELIVQRLVAGRQDLIPQSYIDDFKGMPGVKSVKGRLWGYYYDPQSRANFTIMVSDKGQEPGTVVIGRGISRTLGIEVGDFITLRTYKGTPMTLEITRVFDSSSEIVSADLVLISREDFYQLFDFPRGLFTDIAIEVYNPQETLTLAKKIVLMHPDTRPVIKDEILRTYASILNWRSGVIAVLLMIGLFSFVIFSWDRATGLSAEEKREIGILKALGWDTSDVILLKFWEGVVVSLSSFLTGIILAYLHVYFGSAFIFEEALKGWSVLYPSFRLVPAIDLYQILTLFFLTVVPYTVSTIVPAWRVAITDPDSVMRL
ncbi:MAG: ABC transporter permease [Nitrospirae bacterium]|nr:MAG: ABC transporter permease [Nitrospirota bacterium]